MKNLLILSLIIFSNSLIAQVTKQYEVNDNEVTVFVVDEYGNLSIDRKIVTEDNGDVVVFDLDEVNNYRQTKRIEKIDENTYQEREVPQTSMGNRQSQSNSSSNRRITHRRKSKSTGSYKTSKGMITPNDSKELPNGMIVPK